jgi:hypothetical protein
MKVQPVSGLQYAQLFINLMQFVPAASFRLTGTIDKTGTMFRGALYHAPPAPAYISS